MPDPTDPTDDLIHQMVQAGLYPEQIAALAPRLKIGESMLQQQHAQGRSVGVGPFAGTYVASSPLEHLSNAFRQIAGAGITKGAMNRQQDLTQQLGQGREAYQRALGAAMADPTREGTQGVGPGGQPMYGVSGNPEPMQRLILQGAGSGDSAMQGTSQAYMHMLNFQRQLEVLKSLNAYRNGQLGLGEKRIEQAERQQRPSRNPANNQLDIVPTHRPPGSPQSPIGASQAAADTAPPMDTSTPVQAPQDDGLEPIPQSGQIARDYEKMKSEFAKAMDSAGAGRTSAFGNAANVVFRGARAMAVLRNPDGTPRQPTVQEWQDIAANVVAMQTNGIPSERMTFNLVPKDYAGDWSKIMQWLKAAPDAPDRQEWVQRFTGLVQNEQKTAEDFEKQTRGERFSNFGRYAEMYPKRLGQQGRAYGITSEMVDQLRTGKYRMPEKIRDYNPKTGALE